MEPWAWWMIAAIPVGLGLLALGVAVVLNGTAWTLRGAVHHFGCAAADGGFVGVGVLVILWILATPVMIALATFTGFVLSGGDEEGSRPTGGGMELSAADRRILRGEGGSESERRHEFGHDL
ncbi:hypothetical protein KBTX_02795 [wastewater metagenome]|uniref:Uncharacterized protein n=2 Tax=unclassified sequences TaxID=12908 RepID=A0A5B8RI67_9ZZZZ|nr:hypothetical protein [Arhodomonas sp. KWT]QEA06457.1 hypothetical protein KBTEX_02795 [uncultured organism]